LALEQAAKLKGRSLSSEVEYRLRRSFEDDKSIVEHLGGRQSYALLRAVLAAMVAAGERAYYIVHEKRPEPGAWLFDTDAYSEAASAARRVLSMMSPGGESRQADLPISKQYKL
jgi:hypothetical protein